MDHINTVKSPHKHPCPTCGKVRRFNIKTGRLSSCPCVKARTPPKMSYCLKKGEGEDFRGDQTAWKSGEFKV